MIANPDPFHLRGFGYLMDGIPSIAMALVMQRCHEGDQIVLARVGKGYCWQGGEEPIPINTVKALLNRQWLVEPDLALFGDWHSGRLTVRGEYALNRYHFG